MRILASADPRPLNLLALGPNGLVAAAETWFGPAGAVEVWDAALGTLVYRNQSDGFCESLAFTPDGRYLAVAARGLTVLEVAGWSRLWNPDYFSWGSPVAFAASGARVLVAPRAHRIECFSYAAGFEVRPLWYVTIAGWNAAVSFELSRDGALAAITARSDARGRAHQEVTIRDAADGRLRAAIALDPTAPVRQHLFTADGSKLLLRTDDNVVRVYDAATGAPAGELAHRGRPYVTAIAVHPRGPVACARTDGTVTLWDVDAGAQLRTLDWGAGRLVSVAFAPDGALGAAGTEDGKVVVWDHDG